MPVSKSGLKFGNEWFDQTALFENDIQQEEDDDQHRRIKLLLTELESKPEAVL